jgi:hypothetical protein
MRELQDGDCSRCRCSAAFPDSSGKIRRNDPARANGMHMLVEDGMEKVKSGQTTLEELIRVIGPQTKFERSCMTCGWMMDAKFLFCPNCGKFRQNYCLFCKLPLEEDWLSCPFCGKIKNEVDIQ